MGLKGKLVRLGNHEAVFGSQKKPEWSPIRFAHGFNPAALQVGEYYDIDMRDKEIVGVTRLEPRSGGGGGGYSAPAQSYSAPSPGYQSQSGPDIPLASLMASATGFAKSAMEGGVCKTWVEAAEAGIAWANRWGEVPVKRERAPAQPTTIERPAAPVEIDDEIPF